MYRNISRLDFLKKIWVGISAAILSSCKPNQAPTPTDTHTPTSTFTPHPSITLTPTATITRSPSQTPMCIILINPENNQELPASGKFRFSWNVYHLAKAYRISLILPNNAILPLSTTPNNFRDQYLDPLAGGIYEWYVEALDNEGNVICISNRNKFSKQTLPDNSDQSGYGKSGSPGNPQPTLKPPQTENT